MQLKTWRIELSYPGIAGFSCTETAMNLGVAIDNAIHYARACGWPAIPTKKRAIELSNQSKEK